MTERTRIDPPTPNVLFSPSARRRRPSAAGPPPVPWRIIAAVAAVTVGVVLSLMLIWQLRSIVALVVVAGFLAVALDRPVQWVERKLHVRRGLAVGAVLIVLTLVLAATVFVIIRPLIDQVRQFSTDFPGYVNDAAAGRGAIGRFVTTIGADTWVRAHQDDLGGAFGVAGPQALNAVVAVGGSLVAFVTIGVLTVLLLLEWPRWTLLSADPSVKPSLRRQRVLRVVDDCSRSVGGYVMGNLLISVVAGTVAFVALEIAGVPFAAPLALWVAIADLIPLVGATIGAVPAVGVAFLQSVPAGVGMLIMFVVYQLFESNVLQVVVMAHTVKLDALVVFVAVVCGASLAGLVGALLAIPVAGIIQVLVRDVVAERRLARAAAAAADVGDVGDVVAGAGAPAGAAAPIQGPLRLRLEQRADPASVAELRRRTAAALRSCGFDETAEAELSLVATELLATAAHAAPGGDCAVELSVETDTVRLSVHHLGDEPAAGSRPMAVLRALSDSLAVASGESGTTITASRQLASPTS